MITASLEKEGEKLAYHCFTDKVNPTVVYIERKCGDWGDKNG